MNNLAEIEITCVNGKKYAGYIDKKWNNKGDAQLIDSRGKNMYKVSSARILSWKYFDVGKYHPRFYHQE